MGTIREYRRDDSTISYHAEVRLRGHPAQRASFRTKSLAKQWIQDTESAIRDGRHFKTSEAKRRTVGEMIDRFISQWLPKYPKRQGKQTALLTWWKDKIGHLYLSDLTPAVIAESRDVLLAENTVRKRLRTPSTVNRYLAALSKVLTVAVKEWGWLDDSPMRKVTKPTENPGRNRLLNLEEKDRLLEACRASSNPLLFPIVSIALHTGMRLGEILNLDWSHIDFTHKLITLEQTKNGERRVLPLIKPVEDILINLGSKKTGWVFPARRNDSKSGLSTISKAFQRALKAADIFNYRPHDLRHQAASQMAMAGATQGELMAILGHKTPTMTRRYAHYSQGHIKRILEKTSSVFSSNEEKND